MGVLKVKDAQGNWVPVGIGMDVAQTAVTLQKVAVQNMAAGWVVCTFPATEFDTEAMATAPGYIKVKRAGLWLASYSVTFAAIATAGRVVPAICRNGDTNGQRYASASVSVAANDDGSVSSAAIIKLNANDWLEVFIFNANARDFGVAGAAVPGRFSAVWLGT